MIYYNRIFFFFFQAEDGIRDKLVTGVQTCALPIFRPSRKRSSPASSKSPTESGVPHEETRGAQARHLSAHLPSRVLRADEGNRRGEARARREHQALAAHPGALGPGEAREDDAPLAGLPAGAHAFAARD